MVVILIIGILIGVPIGMCLMALLIANNWIVITYTKRPL